MIAKLTLALVCFLAPLLAGAGPLEVYADLTGKTVLQPPLPPLPDSISSDLPADKTEAIAKIESELAKLRITAIQDGPHFVRLVEAGGRHGSVTEVPLRGAELAASKSPATMAAGSINFINVGLEQVLSIYGELRQRTLLRAVQPAIMVNLKSTCALTPEEAAYAIETDLALQGIAMVEDGPHFIRVGTKEGLRDSMKDVPLQGAEFATSNSPAGMPTGSINFIRLPLEQLLPIYGQMSRRTILRSAALPPVMVSLRTTTPLTREETIYALKTVLGLNGIAVVEDGQKFLEIMPMAQRSSITAHAPKPEPDAELLNPNQMPSLGDTVPKRPPTKAEQELARVQKALYEYIHDNRPPDSARRLLEFYADLTGKNVQPAKKYDPLRVWFHVEMPLTKSELLYAIETSFNLENLAIIQENEKDIRLGSMAEAAAGNQVSKAQPKP